MLENKTPLTGSNSYVNPLVKKSFEIHKGKVIRWMDTKNGNVMWGIDLFVNKQWVHVKDNDEPLFYKTKKEALIAKNEILLTLKS